MQTQALLVEVESITGRKRRFIAKSGVNCAEIQRNATDALGGQDVDGGQKGFEFIVDEKGRPVPDDPSTTMAQYFNLDDVEAPQQRLKLFLRFHRYQSYSDYILSHLPMWKQVVVKLVLAIIGSFFLAALSQVAFYWPWNPTVPVSFQTLAVFVNGALLGFIFGPVSVGLYLLWGAVGAPFFASQTSGVKILQGPTSGYLLGFILAAFFVGLFSQLGWDRRWRTSILSMMIGNLIIYIFGVPVLAWHLRATTGFGRVLVIGVVNFLAGDAIKIGIAALLIPVGWKALAFVFNRKDRTE